MTFHSMLKAQGFKRMKSYAKGTTCMISENESAAAEIYTRGYSLPPPDALPIRIAASWLPRGRGSIPACAGEPGAASWAC